MAASCIFFAGGGTGGHLYPGISVAQSIRKRWPGMQCVFLCTERPIDRTILEPTGFEFIPQPIVPPVQNISGLLKFWTRWRETKDLVRKVRRQRKPAAVLGLGGYAAGVVVKSCATHRIPAAIINPDVIPGKANQYLMRYSKAVCCQFDQTRVHVPASQQGKLHTTGCPVRSEILNLPPREVTMKKLGLDPLLKTLVVTGASQGAQTVNQAILTALSTIKLQGWQILHLSGKEHAEEVRSGYRELPEVPVRVIDFISEMHDIWAVADITVCRSGASTCAELTACGTPSILFPYPFHKDMHQRANAKVLADAGAAILMEDTKDRRTNAAALKPVLESFLYDANRRQAMAESARKLGHPQAAEAVADVIMQMIQ
ncbi:MAG TPA: UDP-N-acetylglucosamine--N-acetylmuramyl-(pentapeptide) pyrophosphoryl-undecaprenol N-acetylglucosamine transferase [Tepidisphaeraceae bacterium]|jgi:UDP-N-acetylglucosamine--N-acetylmuramyl-(pentapeptide) pyrophosphoryl-undecaprenol N-acetylglucosamine transferase